MPMRNKYVFTLLKILAFIIPFYFVFYGPLHSRQENQSIKVLWKYVLLGFLAYILAFIIFQYIV
jgi:drug/metabolite transporter (DMT)-like permease